MIYTNYLGLSETIIRQLSLPYQGKDKRIGITTLIDAPFIRQFMIDHWDQLQDDYSSYLQTVLGIGLHDRAERLAKEAGIEAETKHEIERNGWTIVGKDDEFEDGIVRDHKVSNVGYLKFHADDIERQLNMYALFRRLKGQKVKGLEGILWYKNWDWKSVVWPKKGMDYPNLSVEVYKPRLWSQEEQEEYLDDQLHYHEMNKDKPCSTEERWNTPEKYCVTNANGRSLRNLDTYEQAEIWIHEGNKKNVEIVRREGCSLRCQYYCTISRNKMCPFYSGPVYNWIKGCLE